MHTLTQHTHTQVDRADVGRMPAQAREVLHGDRGPKMVVHSPTAVEPAAQGLQLAGARHHRHFCQAGECGEK